MYPHVAPRTKTPRLRDDKLRSDYIQFDHPRAAVMKAV